MTSFPDGFLWGTATAAHQIEGGNTNSDWWSFEHAPGTPAADSSGDACDSWHRWSDDVAIVADLGLGAYRFSVEWARIEPADGEYSRAAMDHYLRVAEECHRRGVEPLVTLHHFTTPQWIADRDGWANPDTAERLAAYCERIVTHLGDAVGTYFTINEPNMVTWIGYELGHFPPGERSRQRRLEAHEVMMAGHRGAMAAIRAAAPHARAGMTVAMNDWIAEPGGEEMLEDVRDLLEHVWLRSTEGDDFVGVQTYSRNRVDTTGMIAPREGSRIDQMGWEFRPEALGQTVRRAAEITGLPILVSENGLATIDDGERIEFAEAALQALAGAIADGVDVRGYLHWSLLDNFEWAEGYRPKFGLVAVDPDTFDRSLKDSAKWFAAVARGNAIPARPGSSS